MKSDSEIERDVKDELSWDPDLDATDIAVSVKKGVVTLTGFVKSLRDKYEAEAAVKRDRIRLNNWSIAASKTPPVSSSA